jgi:hypothetical protein
MDESERRKAVGRLRADRIGFCLLGLILGGSMIGLGAWSCWLVGRLYKTGVLLAFLGYLFAQGGVSIWRHKGGQIRELESPPKSG